MKHARIQSFFDPATFTVTHVVSDPETARAAIIDSVLDYDPKSGRTSRASADAVIAHVRQAGLAVDWLLETHAHADHLSAAPYLKQQLGGRIAIGAHIRQVQGVFKQVFNAKDMNTDGVEFDQLFEDGERFRIGTLDVAVMHTPGHTPACLTYVVGRDAFVGDTLFMPDYGTARCDFPGGDAATLFRSIRKVLALPPETRLHLCHDYPPESRAAAWETTVAEQRRNNIHVHDGVTEAEFVAMRSARDKTLAMPTLILPSIQVNVRAGNFPPPEDNGVRYLKIPLDLL
ncbi:MBL fold metallo-hydrolase [Thauera linaloolentis]|uniref:Beta-lactamase domain-containing protein n=1 Tax=Thauera linaloolentis (strain DSM 12138 / JCM 21573 / CCUG 41526 / CIP 105981 / IAM 15112 / NBRC 102519 / 47Lol) TaxID=1123367 RepID=N6ZCW3_THAL4|nr:MBL fold metallo-hydrolase [Thauera linaloolentis]ENO90029.1 beta-lactamase domain-containing protein [Thauera linaloolentis 47Lol = DSM 12138]MCM8565312.1 MBL fold metallo-hydrolase [Thauera linaloolentis]